MEYGGERCTPSKQRGSYWRDALGLVLQQKLGVTPLQGQRQRFERSAIRPADQYRAGIRQYRHPSLGGDKLTKAKSISRPASGVT